MSAELYNAISANDEEEAVRLIKKGRYDKNYVDQDTGSTILIAALKKGMINVIKLMFERGIVDADNINIQDELGQTALHHAYLLNNLEVAKILIENGVKNTKDYYGRTPLHLAACKGMTSIIRLMCEKGVVNTNNIDIKDRASETALCKACYVGENDVVKVLIKYGANISNEMLGVYRFIKTIKNYQKVDANVDNSDEYWLAISNRMAVLSSYGEMREFVLARPSLQEYLGIDRYMNMFYGNWQDFFDQCYMRGIHVSQIASNSRIPVVVLKNALLYGVHWENVEEDHYMVKTFASMLIDNPQFLKDDDVLAVLQSHYKSVVSILAAYLDHFVDNKEPKVFEIFLSLCEINSELWDKCHDKFEDTKYFSQEEYHLRIDESKVLYNWSVLNDKSIVELGKIADKTIVVPLECATDSHAVWLLYKAIAANEHGVTVDVHKIAKKALQNYNNNVLKILQASGFDVADIIQHLGKTMVEIGKIADKTVSVPFECFEDHRAVLLFLKAIIRSEYGVAVDVNQIAEDAAQNHDTNVLKILQASGFDVSIDIITHIGETNTGTQVDHSAESIY